MFSRDNANAFSLFFATALLITGTLDGTAHSKCLLAEHLLHKRELSPWGVHGVKAWEELARLQQTKADRDAVLAIAASSLTSFAAMPVPVAIAHYAVIRKLSSSRRPHITEKERDIALRHPWLRSRLEEREYTVIKTVIEKPTIHWYITPRPFESTPEKPNVEAYLEALEHSNQRLRGIRGELKDFPEPREFIEGRQWILDLGGGNSNFSPTLIHRKLSQGHPDLSNIHAHDRAYSPEFYKFSVANTLSPKIRRTVEKYPDNFHGGHFQELHIVGPDGQRILFDEIVSNNALAWVLKRASAEECGHLLRVIVDHLKPGGTLRFWIGDSHPNSYWKTHALSSVLGEMIAAGEIANHSELSDDAFVMVIQR